MLTLLLPEDERLGPTWFLPLLEGLLLVAVVAGDPWRINRRSRLLRALSIGLVAVLGFSAVWSTVLLIAVLINGGPETNSASALLSAGTTVWVSNNIAFGLLYWELDGGGAAARAHQLPRHPDFAFPQQMNPDLAPAGWRPQFLDYLYLGFTQRAGLQPGRRHAPGAVGQARDGVPVDDLAGHPRPGDRPGRERVHLARAAPSGGSCLRWWRRGWAPPASPGLAAAA